MRTVSLVVVSLAVVGGAFTVYQLSVGLTDDRDEGPTVVTTSAHEQFLDEPFEEGHIDYSKVNVPMRPGKEALFQILDDHMRKKMEIGFDDREPVDETGEEWKLKHPKIHFYMPDGEKATVRADEGLIRVRATGKMEPLSGRLWGHVQIIVDRTNDRWRNENPGLANLPTPQRELIRMWMNEIDFDRQRGILKSTGAVRIESQEMRLSGRGLEVRWSDALNRIESLTIQEGQKLTFESAFALGVDLVEEERDGQLDSAVLPPAPPSPDEQALRLTYNARLAELRARDDVIVIDMSDKPVDEVTVNTYRATFNSSVVAKQEGGQSGGLRADFLAILVDIPSGASTESRREEHESAAVQSDADGSTAAAPPPVDKPRHKVHITWEGPLVIRSVKDAIAIPGVLRREVVARGQPVVLESNDGRATAAELVRHVHTGFTQLTATPDHPVVLIGEGDMKLTAGEVVTLNLQDRKIDLDGQVTLRMDGSDLEARRIEASFAAPDSQRRRRGLRELIETLDCHDDVRLTQSDGSDLRSERLIVKLSPDAEGRNLPKHAEAQGNVRMVQGQRRVAADHLDVHFGDIPKDAAGNATGRWPAVRRLEAVKDVVVVDPDRGWDVSGARLKCDFDEDQVITFGHIVGQDGRDAHVKLDDYFVQGAEVTFDDSKQWAHVPGPGIARFTIAGDLDGRKADRPVPVEVQWTDKMELRGAEDVLVFEGQAVARSAANTLRGDLLEIALEDVPLPAPAAASAAPSDPFGLWVLRPVAAEMIPLERLLGKRDDKTRYARTRLNKRATRVAARGGATIESLSRDRQSQALTSRMTMESAEIHFDLLEQVLRVDQQGALGIEDYPTESRVAQRRAESSGGLFGDASGGGPSQTVMTWDSAMRYHYGQRVAEFIGSETPVNLNHFAGAELQSVPGLDPARLADIKAQIAGRRAGISTHRLVVQFAGAAGGRGGGQMSFGQLDQFEADGDVVLHDSKDGWYVTGDRLMFVGDRQLIEAYGSAAERAYISRVDRASGKGWEWKCEKLFLELDASRVYGPDCEARSIGQ
jgi:hypothetical protein